MSEKLFDVNQQISIKAQLPDGSIKAITVRFPTDEELIERGRRIKVVTLNLGRGIQETVDQDPDPADAELINKILRMGEGPDVDEYEAYRIIEEITSSSMGEAAFDGEKVSVPLTAPGGIKTAHELRLPTAKEKFTYDKQFASVRSQQNKQVMSFSLSTAGDLYDKLKRTATGYAGDIVPIVHKQAVVLALLRAREAALGSAEVNF